jgi:hypothetical protein
MQDTETGMRAEVIAYDATEIDMRRQQDEVATALAAYKALEAGYRRSWKTTYQGHLTKLGEGKNANRS